MNYLYETKLDRIKVGRKYMGIGSRLIGLNIKPKNNWAVGFDLNGIPEKTEGVTWFKAINSMTDILERNGIENALSIAWVTCNIRWMEETHPNYHIVPLEYLLKHSTKIGFEDNNEPEEIEDEVEDDGYLSPSVWGSSHWDYMGWDLSFETTTVKSFRMLVENIMNKLDIKQHPSRGCQECFSHFSYEVLIFDKNVKTLDQAKQWLLDTHNKVNKLNNKPIFSMDQAKKRYGW